jgi:hypothetical protein
MITSRAVFALHYCITGVSSRRHAATRDYAETLQSKLGVRISRGRFSKAFSLSNQVQMPAYHGSVAADDPVSSVERPHLEICMAVTLRIHTISEFGLLFAFRHCSG